MLHSKDIGEAIIKKNGGQKLCFAHMTEKIMMIMVVAMIIMMAIMIILMIMITKISEK